MTEKEPDAIELPIEAPIKVLGIRLEVWLAAVQKVGFSTLFVTFLCIGAYNMVPPVVAAHLRLLERTGDVLEQTLEDHRKMLNKLEE